MTTVAIDPTDLDPTELESVADRFLADTTTFTEYLSIWLGLELGLYEVLRGAGPLRSGDVSRRADVDERYTREWLEHQVVAGWLACPNPAAAPDDRTFELSPAVAAVLLEPDSGAYLGPLATMVSSVCAVLDPLVDAYRNGTGVPYSSYGARIRHGLGVMNGTTFDHDLADWVEAMPDLRDRLETTPRPQVLDLGCGVGRSSLALARVFPRADVRGLDLDPASIADAREAASAAGLADRVTFTEGDAADATNLEDVDLVTTFEALHDMGDPVGALAAAREVLADHGVVYLVDERVADAFTTDADPVERLQYGFSVLHCLPATRAEEPVVANGTVLRRPTVEDWAAAAGFGVTELEIDDPFWRHYRLDPTS